MALLIEFSSHLKGLIPEPKPASNFVPESYKKLPNEIEEGITVKKCIPFRDALLTGYVLTMPVDYRFSYSFNEKSAYFDMNPGLPEVLKNELSIGVHPNYQLGDSLLYKKRTLDGVFKFMNHWVIKTPPGYSCIFTQPFNRDLPFKIIDAVVDTDKFFSSVKLPFYWHAPIQDKIIMEAGSPMCLVIPFKRQNWKIKTSYKTENQIDRVNFFRKFWDNYKTHSWSKKTYK